MVHYFCGDNNYLCNECAICDNQCFNEEVIKCAIFDQEKIELITVQCNKNLVTCCASSFPAHFSKLKL